MKTMQSDECVREKTLDPTQSFIVQAPAGSGKTELLTQRYLVLLAHAKQSPEEIIAITFTRKSAAEMRNRILNALEFASTPEPLQNHYQHKTWSLAKKVLEKDQQHRWQLMQNPNRLRIMTIDALATWLCRQTPLLTEWGANVEITENPDLLYQRATQQFLQTVIDEKKWQPSLSHLLLHLDNQVEKLETLLIELLSHRDQWLPHILLGMKNTTSIRSALENSLKKMIVEKIQLAKNQIPEEQKQTLLLLARHAGLYLQQHNAAHPIAACADVEWKNHITFADFPAWFGLASLLLKENGEFRKTVTIQQGFPSKDKNKLCMMNMLSQLQHHDALKETLQDIVMCPPAFYHESQWETLQALIVLLPILCAQLSLVFREKEKIDFVELNMTALKALGSDESPTDLALYLDYQICHLLVDEFQDTSITHLQLLEKITAGWEKQDGRTLFLVGDPMQSIYRFRNAEVGLFLRVQQNGLGAISLTPLTLTSNFRSEKKLVEWFNHAFHHIFPKSADIASGRVMYSPSVAIHHHDTKSGVTFYPILQDDDKTEATILVDQIESCLQHDPNDTIAILVRARSQLAAITALMQEKKMAFQAVDIESLIDHPEIQDVLSLTRACLHRGDRVAWLSLLRSPLCGCVLSDLLLIAQAAVHQTIYEVILQAENIALSHDGLTRLKRLRTVLQFAFQPSDLSLPQRVKQIWIALGGPATLNAWTDMQHVDAYFALLEKMTDINLSYLEHHLAKTFPEPVHKQEFRTSRNSPSAMGVSQGGESRFSPLSASANSLRAKYQLQEGVRTKCETPVQIMTIHKAKGLEFDHVFIPGLHKTTPADSEKLFRWLEQPNTTQTTDLILAPIKSADEKEDAIYQYLKHIENKKSDHETTRLLYVALTRAKKSAHLFAAVKAEDSEATLLKKPKSGSFLEKLWPVLQYQITTHSIIKTNAIQNTNHHQQSLLKRHHSDWQMPLPLLHQSVLSDNTAKIDIHFKTKQHSIVGTVIHEILYEISKTDKLIERNKTDFSREKWRSRLLSLGLLSDHIDAALATIQLAIQNMLSDERGLWILSSHPEAQSELAFTILEKSAPASFIIDRTFVDEHQTRWIIDYKTAIPPTNESLIHFLNTQKKIYESQLNQYAMFFLLKETRPIQLGLYFPLCKGWIAWEFLVSEKLSETV